MRFRHLSLEVAEVHPLCRAPRCRHYPASRHHESMCCTASVAQLDLSLQLRDGAVLRACRWLGVITLAELIMHGFLYQVLWWSDSWGMWVSEMKKFDMGHVSNLPGAVAWGAAVLMAAFAWPCVRRKAYRVRLSPHQHHS